MTAAASLKGNSDLSEWTVYVNDAENCPDSYTAANTKFRVYGIGDNAGDVYDCGTVYLSQGANTLYWQFGKASGRDKLYAAMDYFELTPVPVGIRRVAVSSGTFTAAIQKSHPLTASAHAFIAVYRNGLTGKLESINSVSIDSEEGEQEISLPLSVSNGNAVKILLWYDNTMQPLCKPVQISVIED